MPSDRSGTNPARTVHHARRRIARIFAVTQGDSLESYLANEERQESEERNFIGIGEAVKDLARMIDLQVLDPGGPWREASRFRDFLAHQYEDGVSHPDVWRTIKEDLPQLDAALARLESLLPKGGRG